MKLSLLVFFVLTLSTGSVFAQANQNTTNTKDYLQVDRYEIKSDQLKIQDQIKDDLVYIKIYYKEKSCIIDDYEFFKPKKNEILFFYGFNPENKEPQMFFKFDKNLESIYKKKDVDQIVEIIEVLEYNVFSTVEFSVAEAYNALDDI